MPRFIAPAFPVESLPRYSQWCLYEMHLMPLFQGNKKAPIASGLLDPTLPMPFGTDRIFFRGHPMMEGLPFS
jgi:hypothetical protein